MAELTMKDLEDALKLVTDAANAERRAEAAEAERDRLRDEVEFLRAQLARAQGCHFYDPNNLP